MPTFAGDSGPRVIHAAHLALDWEPVAPAHSVSGDPRTGSAEVVTAPGIEVGVWSHTPGVSTDTEADEVFVVLSGRARIEFADGDRARRRARGHRDPAPGAQTTWTVHEELRKVYVIRSDA